MEKVTVPDLDRHLSTASVKRPVGEALGIEGFALQYYALEPGETFSTNLHTHLDQEEVFYSSRALRRSRPRRGRSTWRQTRQSALRPGSINTVGTTPTTVSLA